MSYIDPRAKLGGHLETLAALRRGERPAPVNVEIDLSNRCSLGCQGCHFGYTHTRGPLAGKRDKPAGAVAGGDLMARGLAVRVLGELAAAGVKSVTWTGGGEPTLHPNFDELLEWAARNKLEQGIYTHGGHVEAKRAAQLKRYCAWVYVSLDACDRESYRLYKQADYFERACAGIRHLVQASGAATIGVGFLLHAANWQQAPAMVDLSRSLGADYCQFRPLVLYTQEEPGWPAGETAWADECLPLLAGLSAPDVICDLSRFEMYANWAGHGYATCWWAGLSTVITPDGKVWTCTNKREHPAALLGDLSAEAFDAVWARGGRTSVNHDCRVLCRGHVANTALASLLADGPHANFI